MFPKSYVPLLDDKLQYTAKGIKLPRHLVINNLPGTCGFCPLITKTQKLERYIAFGFVFIHPFEDGNGRIHRYLIHHILAKKQVSWQGIIFPVSASMLDHIDDYRKVLEEYSQPLLDFIRWKETSDHQSRSPEQYH